MKTLGKAIRRSTGLWLLLTISLTGCWSYVSKEAQERFQALEGPFSVTVYPVHVVKGPTVEHDEDLAIRLIAFLREENLANPVLSTETVEIPVTWRHSQPRMAHQSAIAFAEQVKTTGVQTEYALLVEIFCNPAETKVGGVHFYLSDPTGNLASGGLTNSHWEEFKEVQPQDREGGYEVATRMLRRIWKRH